MNYLQAVYNVLPNFPRQLLSLILCVRVGPGTEEDHEKHAEQEVMNSFGFLNGTTSGNYMLHCFLSFARGVLDSLLLYCNVLLYLHPSALPTLLHCCILQFVYISVYTI